VRMGRGLQCEKTFSQVLAEVKTKGLTLNVFERCKPLPMS
jgi:hypothetical protein